MTLCSGTTGRAGEIVTASNSVIGSTSNDWLSRVVALPNGNYVVSSPHWDNPAPAKANVGVAALCSGITGRTGMLSSANALVGSAADDQLSNNGGVVALANGNYVVVCSSWDNPLTLSNNVGAVTWCNGTTGRSGELSPNNSLVGLTDGSRVGSSLVVALAGGHYVVGSPIWDNNATYAAGAATWCNGTTGRTGLVSAANSLIGSSVEDSVADDSLLTLPDGNFVVVSAVWRNGAIASAGAVTLGNGNTETIGPITSTNSVLETVANAFDTFSKFYGYDVARSRLAVASSVKNIVTLLTTTEPTALKLSILANAPGQHTISWTPSAAGYILQETPGFLPAAWTNSPSGSTNPVILPSTQSAMYYRLFKP